jgi:hypothetical protein
MSANYFKSDSNYNSRNNHTNKKEIHKEFNNNLENDFPLLIASQKSNTPVLNYKQATNRQVLQEKKQPQLNPGITEYTTNKKTKEITVAYGPVTPNEYDEYKKSDEYYTQCVLNKLESNYERYKEHFIECYGEDCYVDTFLMPNYTPLIIDDELEEKTDSDENNNYNNYNN